MGFEPTRAEPNGLAVHRLNHSATSSCVSVEYDRCKRKHCCVLGSIVVSIPACHAGDRGSIPRRGGYSSPFMCQKGWNLGMVW